MPHRQIVGLGVVAALLVFVALDAGASRPLNPFAAPSPAALGSGAAPSGAHCAASPT